MLFSSFSIKNITNTAPLAVEGIKKAFEDEKLAPYATPYASLSLPYDLSIPNIAETLRQAETLVIIGIGGSNLGTLAVMDALRMNKKSGKEIISLDTVDTADIERNILYLREKLEKGEHIIITTISKSGTTAETIGIFEILYAKLYSEYKNQVHIVTISDPGSKLDLIAEQQGWTRYHLPKNVGGRYSVLSSVGLFPLLWLGVDVHSLRAGAREALEDFIKKGGDHPANTVASSLAGEYKNGRNIFEHFFFAKNLENLGKWYRQLLAESVGKIQKDGQSIGITPTTSIGTTDLHSVAQLDLAHTRDRSMAVVSLRSKNSIRIGSSLLPELVENIRGKSLDDIMLAAEHGFIGALKTKDLPVFHYEIEENNAHDLGYFLQTKMLEVMLTGLILEINPFDQPNVEDYKTGMKEYMKR